MNIKCSHWGIGITINNSCAFAVFFNPDSYRNLCVINLRYSS